MTLPKTDPTPFNSSERFWDAVINEHESEYARIFTDAYSSLVRPHVHGFFRVHSGNNYFLSGITHDESASALLRFQPRGEAGITNASGLEIYIVGRTDEESSTPLFAVGQTLEFINSKRNYLTSDDSISGRIWLPNNSSRRTPTVMHKPGSEHRSLVDEMYNDIRVKINSSQYANNVSTENESLTSLLHAAHQRTVDTMINPPSEVYREGPTVVMVKKD